jgi:GDP-L-fucose synthase
MRILITGGSGFIGSRLVESISEKYEIEAPTHQELDLTSRFDVDYFFESKKFDLVIHCAIQGGKSHIKDDSSVFYNNVNMFANIIRNKRSFSHMINFTSGYELENNKDLFESFPDNYYGLSKNIISRICSQHETVTNLRLFGLFGENEYAGRFVKKSINNSLLNLPIEIYQDIFWDFLYIDDLVLCVSQILEDPKKYPKSFDLVYTDKIRFSDVADLIKKISGSESKIIIGSKKNNNDYLGDGKTVNEKMPNLMGVELGLMKMISNIS